MTTRNSSSTQPRRVFALRDARAADATALTEFMRASFVEANGHCSSRENVEAFLASVYTPVRQHEEIKDATKATLLATAPDGGIAGYVQLALHSPPPPCVQSPGPAAQLLRLYVDARHHGGGLGASLMHEAKRRVRAAGARTMWLNAWQEARRALAFYAKHGFEIVGVASFVVGGDPKPNWTLACALDEENGDASNPRSDA